ncbi:MAG: type II secretion system protein N [Pseudomonadota bacterium]
MSIMRKILLFGTKERKSDLRSHWNIGFITFFLSIIVLAPASLLTPVLTAAGLEYRALQGRIWSGHVLGLSIRDVYAGDLEFRFGPLSLVTGKIGYYVEAKGGAGVGDGTVSLGIAGLRINDVNARFDLSSIKQYSMFGLAYDGSVQADVEVLEWTRKGCMTAAGTISTNAFSNAMKRFSGEDVEFIGTLECQGNDLALKLDGQNSKGSATIAVKVTPNLTYVLNAIVQPKEEVIVQRLKTIGFDFAANNERSLVFDARGPIRGLGS